MPLLALVDILVKVYFAVHAIKTGRSRNWLFIIIFFPMVGSLIYFFAEYLPDLQYASKIRQTRSNFKSPKKLRDLKDQVEITPSVKNKKALAEGYVHAGLFDKAIPIYESCLQGLHEEDLSLLEGLWCAYFFKGDFSQVKVLLLQLRKLRGAKTDDDFDLLLARTFEELGETDKALEEYEALVKRYAGYESRCRYALLLKKIGKIEEARTIFEQTLKDARLSPKFFQKEQKKWIKLAKNEL